MWLGEMVAGTKEEEEVRQGDESGGGICNKGCRDRHVLREEEERNFVS